MSYHCADLLLAGVLANQDSHKLPPANFFQHSGVNILLKTFFFLHHMSFFFFFFFSCCSSLFGEKSALFLEIWYLLCGTYTHSVHSAFTTLSVPELHHVQGKICSKFSDLGYQGFTCSVPETAWQGHGTWASTWTSVTIRNHEHYA